MAFRASSTVFIVAGFVIAAVGGAFSVKGVLMANREQAELVLAESRRQAEIILGESRTFCQLIVYANDAIGFFLSTYHNGSGPIYDVDVLVREVRENGTQVSPLQRVGVGTLTSNTWPWNVYTLGINGPQVNLTPRYFAAQMTQRNGTSQQEIVIYPQADGGVRVGFLRLEFNGQPHQPDFRWARDAVGIEIPAAEVARISALRQNARVQP